MLDPNLTHEEKLDLFNRAKEAYYNGEEIISDADYDQLEKELGLENKSYVGSKKGNYTQKHSFIMGSLAKVQIKEDKKTGIVNWEDAAAKINKTLQKSKGTRVYETTPKLDGCSFSLEFKNENDEAVLISCSTRGDGAYGTDIYKWFEKTLYGDYWTKIDDAVASLCKTNSNDIFCIRGEVLIPRASFGAKYQNFANPRAFVAGCINSKWEDKKEQKTMSGDLHFVCYDYRVVDGDTGKFTEISWMNIQDPTYDMISEYLGHIGELPDTDYCQTHPYTGQFTEEELQEIYQDYDDYRQNKCQYTLDGIVFKPAASARLYNDKKERPDDCIAMKFMPMMDGTEIVDIVWTCGKDGEYTPVAYFKPITLDGKAVKKASLHNYNYVMANKVGIGSVIRVSMAGDIIPYVYEVVDGKGNSDDLINKPEDSYVETDPRSGNMHLMKEFTDDGRLLNQFCASAKTLKINAIGPANAEALWKAVHTQLAPLSNILQLTDESAIQLIYDTLGASKSIDNICKALREYRKHVTLEDVIESCSFKSCGERASKVCAKVLRGEQCDVASLPSVSYKWAFNPESPEYKQVMTIVDMLGINMEPEEVDDTVGEQIPIIMTGSPADITNFKTKDEWLKAHPQYVNTTSWKECKILFTDDIESNSGKMKKARQNGVEIRLYESASRLNESFDADDFDTDALREEALKELDYLNQEWVIGWQEDDFTDYVNGAAEPNYIEFVHYLLSNDETPYKVAEMLKTYPNSPFKEDIEITILRAMEDYLNQI